MEVKWLELISNRRVSDWQHGSEESFNGGGSAMGGVLHSNAPLFWATFHPAFGSNNAPECIKLKLQNVNIDRKSSISIDKFKKYRCYSSVLRFKYFPLKRQLFWTTFQLNFWAAALPDSIKLNAWKVDTNDQLWRSIKITRRFDNLGVL